MIFLTCNCCKALMTCGLQVAEVLKSRQITSVLQCTKQSEEKANMPRQVNLRTWFFPVDT
jgi:hypothetical protein